MTSYLTLCRLWSQGLVHADLATLEPLAVMNDCTCRLPHPFQVRRLTFVVMFSRFLVVGWTQDLSRCVRVAGVSLVLIVTLIYIDSFPQNVTFPTKCGPQSITHLFPGPLISEDCIRDFSVIFVLHFSIFLLPCKLFKFDVSFTVRCKS